MKKVFLILGFLLATLSSYAQSSKEGFVLSGTIEESLEQKPVTYATVLLLDSLDNTKAIATCFSEDDGSFELVAPKGSYLLAITYVGYSTHTQNINLTKNTLLPVITISEGKNIDAVAVIGQLVTTEIDKTTYNTEMDPESASLTALEMMRKVPMLSVDGDENITLKGQSSFKILVNGKTSALLSNNYKDVLRSMPANSIKRIEVITDPPARYEAEGLGGIINIITVKKTLDGFTGSLSAGADTFGGVNASGYVALSKGKFSLSGNLYTGIYNSPENNTSTEMYNYFSSSTYHQTATAETSSRGNYYGAYINAAYEFDSLNLLTLGVFGNLGNSNNSTTALYNYFDINNIHTAEFSNIGDTHNNWGGMEASLDYQRSFAGDKERTLTASYKFSFDPQSSYYDTNVDTLFAFADTYITPYQRRADNDAYGTEHALQIDYFDPLNEHHQIEFGAKYILRTSISNTLNEDFINGAWTQNDTLKNDLDYYQHILSGYAGYEYKYKKLAVKAGARAEYTANVGTFKSLEDTPLDADYFNLIPSVSVGYQFGGSQNLKLGYTQRITRPGISQLNPFINDAQPAYVQTGNPDLEPEISHSFNLGYGIYKPVFNINASLSARLTNNTIESVATPYGQGLITRPENVGQNHTYGLFTNVGIRLWQSKVSFNINGNISYVQVKANDGTGAQNQGWQGNLFANASTKLWKDASLNLYGGFGINNISLQSTSMNYDFSGVNISQKFLKNSLALNVGVSNPFSKYSTYTMDMSSEYFSMDVVNESLRRSFKVSLSWNFGKTAAQVKKTRRSISNDDQSSGGDSSSGGAPSGM